MMRSVFAILTVGILMGLVGCSSAGIGGHSQDYVTKGRQIASLNVPVGVPPVNQQAYYAVPPVRAAQNSQYNSAGLLLPPTLRSKETLR